MHTYFHSILMAIFPVNVWLAGCLHDFSSAFVPNLCILLRHDKSLLIVSSVSFR